MGRRSGTRAWWALTWALAAPLLGGLGCRGSADPRYASPEATIETLLRAYRIDRVPEAEVQRRLRANEGFALVDVDGFRGAFLDYGGPEAEGLAGFVLGRLAARKEHLRIVRSPARVEIHASDGRDPQPVVLFERDDTYRVSLRASVPLEVQRQLAEIYRRASRLAGGVGG